MIQTIRANRVKQIDYLLLFNYDDELQNNVANVVNTLNVQNLYFVGEYETSTILGLTNSIYSTSIFHQTSAESFDILDGEFGVERLCDTQNTIAVRYHIDEKNILQILSSVSQSKIESEQIFAKQYLLTFVDKYYNKYGDISTEKFVCKNVYGTSSNIVIIESAELWQYQI